MKLDTSLPATGEIRPDILDSLIGRISDEGYRRDSQRVIKDLRAEGLIASDYDILSIVRDLRLAATRRGDIDSASDQAWSDAVARHHNLGER